jgi:hypothetical protein
MNEDLKGQLEDVQIISIPASRSQFCPWFWSVFKERFFRIGARFFSLPVAVLSQAIFRRSDLLIKALSQVSKPDWVIAHNPGALWPAITAANKFNCKAGFDVEDYHPGEGNDIQVNDLIRQLMGRLLPKMNYVSFAAPLILQQVKMDSKTSNDNWFTLLNYFPASDFIAPSNLADGPVKMVWFSQNIITGRGLELILPFVKKSIGKVELHLVGHLNAGFYESYLKDIPNIIIHVPMKQIELHHLLAQFDIGLALDIRLDKNRDLAITNKLMAYLQSGLFVVATNTSAHESLLVEFTEHGQCFNYATNDTETVLEKILSEIETIRSNKNRRYKNFENTNWETASMDLLGAWKK